MNTLRKMKTVIIVTIIMLTGALTTSCGSDDDGGNEASIVGTWLLTSDTSENFVDGVSQGVTEETVNDDSFVRITFNLDGTYTQLYSESYMNNGMVVVATDTENGTYTISGGTLTINYSDDDGTEYTDILDFTLTTNQLITVYTEENTVNNTTDIYTATFTRQ